MESSPPFVDPFAMPYGAGSTFADYSSMPLFSPVDEFGSGFTTESVGSPMSPVSPVLSTSSYGFVNADDFSSWEGFGQPSRSYQAGSLTPAVNPMDLVMPTAFTNPYLPSTALPQQPSYTVPIPSDRKHSAPTAPKPRTTPPTVRKDSTASEPARTTLKRKASTADDQDASSQGSDKNHGPKKVAHNEIEKRYRTNLNDRIIELRDSVPSLRKAARRRNGEDVDSVEDNAEDAFCPAAHKLNKAAILGKATEYICHLRARNCYLIEENKMLHTKLHSFEMMAAELNIRWPAN